jgi:hypothetical protein
MHKNQTKLLSKIIPFLTNTKEGPDTISFFCPFCQQSGIKPNGRKWYPSERKGYIIRNENSGFEHYVFYCHNSSCESKRLSSSIKGGLALDSFSRYILHGKTAQYHQESTMQSKTEGKPAKINQNSNSHIGQSRSSCREAKAQILPRADRQHMAGQGGYIEKKLKDRREARKSYWDRF